MFVVSILMVKLMKVSTAHVVFSYVKRMPLEYFQWRDVLSGSFAVRGSGFQSRGVWNGER